jgi:uncharacterized protein YcfJ
MMVNSMLPLRPFMIPIFIPILCLTAALAGCASSGPAAPSITVMPGKGKSFEKFQQDAHYCRGAAQAEIDVQSPRRAANEQVISSAVVGTAVGAIAGAAVGAASGHSGRGAAIGAGTGLLAGTAIGVGKGERASGSLQGRYDTTYAQCMKSRGHSVELYRTPRTVTVIEHREPVYYPSSIIYPNPVYYPPVYYPRTIFYPRYRHRRLW